MKCMVKGCDQPARETWTKCAKHVVETLREFASRCMWNDCPERATHGIRLRFWAKGYPRDTHPPAVSDPVVYVCEQHIAEAQKSEWYGPEQRRQISDGMLMAGEAAPDFETADTVAERLETLE